MVSSLRSCRNMIDFKKGYQLRTKMVRDETGDLVTGFHSILSRWGNHFSQLLNIHGIKDVRQREIQTAESPVPEPSAYEDELANEKLKSHKSPGICGIPAEPIKARGRTIRSEINKLINSIWNKEELPEEWKESVVLPICKKGDKIYFSHFRAYYFCQLHTKFIQHLAANINSICR